ncbi:MAG: YcnI family protein, partial [Stackebrandtia sp.]
MYKFARRIGAMAAVAVIGVIAPAGVAAAHVTLSEPEAEAGSTARLDVRVPNESDEADTVKVQLTLPEDYPMVSVTTMDTPGWSVKTEERTLDEPVTAYDREFDEVISQVTWTADSDSEGIG